MFQLLLQLPNLEYQPLVRCVLMPSVSQSSILPFITRMARGSALVSFPCLLSAGNPIGHFGCNKHYH